jgi:hypothetical protein
MHCRGGAPQRPLGGLANPPRRKGRASAVGAEDIPFFFVELERLLERPRAASAYRKMDFRNVLDRVVRRCKTRLHVEQHVVARKRWKGGHVALPVHV